MGLIVLMALPGVSCGAVVAFFTWNAQAGRAFLLSELLWLLALVAVAVLPRSWCGKGRMDKPGSQYPADL
jgi:hypothetical protein